MPGALLGLVVEGEGYEMNELTFTVQQDPMTKTTRISAVLDEHTVAYLGPKIQVLILEKIAEKIAEVYVQEHLQDILKAIDPVAVANLAVADSAAAIRETVDIGTRKLHEDMGDLTREVGRPRELLTPGLLGVKRSILR